MQNIIDIFKFYSIIIKFFNFGLGTMKKVNFLNSYNLVGEQDVFVRRSEKGKNSKILLTWNNCIIKCDLEEDLPKDQGVSKEYQIYSLAGKLHLHFIPMCELDIGVFGNPKAIIIKKINNGATLVDYIQGFLEGIVPLYDLQELFKSINARINHFWRLGFIHGDLTPRNICIGINFGGTEWNPYLIDFDKTVYLYDQKAPKNNKEQDLNLLIYSIQNEFSNLKELDDLLSELYIIE